MAEILDPGIYIIRNKIDGKVYIGQSIYLRRRITDHRRKLQQGCHPNTYLQHAVDRYGIQNFEFRIVERCSYNEIDERERYWIHKFKSDLREYGYNREDGGHNGRKYSPDRVESLCGKGNPMFGKHQTEETKEIIRSVNRGRNSILTVKDVSEIKTKYLTGMTQNDLAVAYGVHISTINKIVRLKNWAWVEPQLNDAIFTFLDNYWTKVDDEIFRLAKTDMTEEEIAKEVGCGLSHVNKLLVGRQKEKRSLQQNLIKSVIADFNAGISKKEIMEKYGISQTSYVRYTTEAFNARKSQMIEDVYRLRTAGLTVKEIAKRLELHRTTVTEYWKTAVKVHGNTEG